MRRWTWAVALAGSLACGNGAGVPVAPTPGPSRIADPPGDTFETDASAGLIAPDVVFLEVSATATLLRIALEFAAPVSPDPARSDFLFGFMELDLDQDADTGLRPSLIEQLRPQSGPRSLGVEREIHFFPDGTVGVRDPIEGVIVGFLAAGYHGSRVTLDVPATMLGGDARVDLALIVGTIAEATDVVPNSGVVRVTPR